MIADLASDIGLSGAVLAFAMVLAGAMSAVVARAIDNGAVALPVASVVGGGFGIVVLLVFRMLAGG